MRSRKGFTLVEIVLVALMFATLSSLVIIDFRTSGRTQRLRAAADEMASRIKQAQGLAYSNSKQMICNSSGDYFVCKSGSSCDAGYPTNCVNQYISRYGVAFAYESSKTRYMIGADYQNSLGNYDVREAIPNGIVKLPTGVIIYSVNGVTNPHASDTNYDLMYVYDSSNASPFLSCSVNCQTTVVLKDMATSITKTVTVQKQTGIVSIQ